MKHDECLETRYEQYIICPYCKINFSDPQEYSDEEEIECDCGETFVMVREVTVEYSTYKKKVEG